MWSMKGFICCVLHVAGLGITKMGARIKAKHALKMIRGTTGDGVRIEGRHTKLGGNFDGPWMVVQNIRRIKRGNEISTMDDGREWAPTNYNVGEKTMGSRFITLSNNIPNLECINVESDMSHNEEEHVFILGENDGNLRKVTEKTSQ